MIVGVLGTLLQAETDSGVNVFAQPERSNLWRGSASFLSQYTVYSQTLRVAKPQPQMLLDLTTSKPDHGWEN